MASKYFWQENKTKEKKKRLKYFLDAGHFPLFLPLCLQNNNKRGKNKNKQKKSIVIYSAYIYIKAFLLGKDGWSVATPTSTQSNK